MTLCHSHRIEDPFVRLKKTIPLNASISLKAKGLLSIAFSRHDNWSFYRCEMLKLSTDGETSFDSGVKELETAGYLHRKTKHDEIGRFVGLEWHFFEDPMSDDEFKKFYREGGFHGTGVSPVPGKRKTTKKDCSTKKDLSTKKELSVDQPPVGADRVNDSSDSDDSPDVASQSEKPVEDHSAFQPIIIKSPTQIEKLTETCLMQKAVACKTKYTVVELRAAWAVLGAYKSIIHDWWRFIEGTIKKQRDLAKGKSYAKKSQKDDNKSNSIDKTQEPTENEKEELEKQWKENEVNARRLYEDFKKSTS